MKFRSCLTCIREGVERKAVGIGICPNCGFKGMLYEVELKATSALTNSRRDNAKER